MEPFSQETSLWEALDLFQQEMTVIQESLTDPEEKQFLGEIMEGYQKARADVEKDLPALMKEMETYAEAEKAKAADIEARVAEYNEEVAARTQANQAARQSMLARIPRPAEVPVTEVPVLDNQTLSAELIAMSEVKPPDDSGSPEAIDSLWRRMDDAKEQETDPAAAPPVPSEPTSGTATSKEKPEKPQDNASLWRLVD